MTASIVLAGVALAAAAGALVLGFRTRRRLVTAEADLAAANLALEGQRQGTAESIAAVRHSTVEEVANLLENFIAKVDTDVAARVAEALALQAQSQAGAEDSRSG